MTASLRGATRRAFLKRSMATLSLAGAGLASPYVSRAADRPNFDGGLQSGDVGQQDAMIWARADRAARLRVDFSTVESFSTLLHSASVDALPDNDFTAKLCVDGLPPGQDIFYRVRLDDWHHALSGERQVGRFKTAPREARPISFAWSGDVAGQGWGIDTARGGMRAFGTMLDNRPDFFIHCGDSIYADCTIKPEMTLPDGTIWRNIVTEDKMQAARTLAQFRGNYKYNLLDDNVRAFNAAIPILAQWDDHEVTNDWSPHGTIDAEGYLPDGTSRLVARARRAFHDYMPTRPIAAEDGRVYRKIAYGPLLDVFMVDMRSYRDSTWNVRSDMRDTCIFGANQLAWLKRELAASKATWKVIAADMPIGLVSEDGIALGDGPPQRREIEVADLLSFMKRANIRNTVWLTADMHYTAAHFYDPNRAVFQDFDSFWEFVSGPLHAGTWSPEEIDNTFGPQAMYQKGCTKDQDNLAPCFGLQFFGMVDIARDGVMTVTLKDIDNRSLWSVDLPPHDDTVAAYDF